MPEPRAVLVTGGAGYIGSHTAKALAAAGYLPVAYDDLSTDHRDFVRWGPLEVGDIRDGARLAEAIGRWSPVALVHFAAKAYVGESVTDPAAYYSVNVRGSLTLLETAIAHGIRHVVFSSSCATYGEAGATPITEATPQAPINPYGRTKLIVEQALADLSAAGALRSVALRYFNAAGADAEGGIGERHEPETHLVPLAIRAARTGEALTVFGDDFPTPDGTAIRDYVHVADLADAHLRALDHLLAGGPSTALNLGTGAGASIREVIGALAAIGIEVPHRVGPRRPGDPARLVADAGLAARTIGWSPRASLREILASAAAWHRTEETR